MSDNHVLIYDDEDDLMYQKADESDAEYKARMLTLHKDLMEKASENDKNLATNILSSLVAEPTSIYK